MTRPIFLLSTLLLASATLAAPTRAQYAVTDLGTLSGGPSSDATGINLAGQVVGYFTGGNGQPEAFLYSGGSMQSLGTFSPSQSCSLATGINNAGQIVGYTQQSYGDGYGTGPTYGFIYSGGTATQFSELGGPAYTFGNAINNAGQVAGLSLVSNSDVTDGFLYSGGSVTDLGNLSGGANGYSDAYGINDHSQVVGNSTVPNSTGRERAFLWQNGSMSDLGDLYGGSANAWAYSINNFGQVVGDSWQTSPSSAHAFLWQSGTMTGLGTFPGGSFSQALDINNSGMIVGDADTSSGAQHAFLYSDGSMQDLNTMIPSGSDWTLEQANAINDIGQIVGYGVNPSGQTDAFLLNPLPEPSSFALLFAGAIGLLSYALRHFRKDARSARWFMSRKISIVATVLSAEVALSAATARGQDIYVANAGNNMIGEYTTSGGTVNASLVSGLGDPDGLAVSGSNLFVVNPGWGTIGEYTTSGGSVNPSLVSGLYGLTHIAVSGLHLFVPIWASFTVGEYATSGVVVNPSLISDSNEPFGIAVSGSHLFVTNYYAGTIGEYGMDGSTVSPSLVSGLSGPEGLVLSGSDLFVASWGSGTIGEYGTDGSTVNPSLVSGLSQPTCIAVSGANLFVTNCAAGTIGEYGMDGSTVNPSQVSGLSNPWGIAISAPVPEPSAFALLGVGAIGLLGFAWRRRRSRQVTECASKVPLAASVSLVLLAQLFGDEARAGTVYDAVNDFSVSSNPNGQWSYLYDTGSGPQLLTYNSVPFEAGYPGLNAWWSGQVVPNSIIVAQNATASAVSYLSIVDPPNLLWLDPEADTVIARWTAPESGTWQVTGLFQGIDTGENAHNVEILENYSTVLLAPTTMSEYGQVVPFDQSVSLTAGDTVDFVVADTGSYANLSTGLSVTISPTPEPSTLALLATGAIGLVGYVWRRRRQKRSLLLAGDRWLSGDAADLPELSPAILSLPSRWAKAARRAA